MSKQSVEAARLRGLVDRASVLATPEPITISTAEATAIADMLAPPNGDSPVTVAEIRHIRQLLFDQGQQMIACGAALRILRVYALGVVEFEEGPEIKGYIRAWIDDGRWLPLAWPDQLPGLADWMLKVGFVPKNGQISLPEQMTGQSPIFRPASVQP